MSRKGSVRSSKGSSSGRSVMTDEEEVVEETAEERIEQFRFFEAVKSKCQEIVPELFRAKTELRKGELRRKYEVLAKIMKDSKVENLEENIELLKDFDKSETIRMSGNVSRTIYNNLVGSRGFDIYGRLRTKEVLKAQEEFRLDEGVELEYEMNVPQVFNKGKEMLKALPLTTPAWKLDKKEKYNAPVGFSKNPIDPTHSMGNEAYYSYDGNWRDGKMEGAGGTYMFADGLKYVGSFSNNARQGEGFANYHGTDANYDGQWRSGRYNGEGVQKCHGGSHYKGNFVLGRRDGQGVVKYGRGIHYEGEFRDGKPHGRGFMYSELSGYAFEGTFVNGRINGSGVLMTPPPEYARVVRIWEKPTSHVIVDKKGDRYRTAKQKKQDDEELGDLGDTTADGFSLPGVVRMYLQELESNKEKDRMHREKTFGRMNAMSLNEYVMNSRNSLHAGRAKEKRDKIIARLKLEEEMKLELKKARMKAYEDLLDEEANKEPWLVKQLKKVGIIPKEEEESEESSEYDSDDDDDSDEDKPKIKRALGSTPEDSLALENMAGAKRVDTSAIVGRPDTAASTASNLNPDGTKKRKQGIKVFNDKGEEVNLKTGDAMIVEQPIEEEPEPEPEKDELFAEEDLPAYMRGKTIVFGPQKGQGK